MDNRENGPLTAMAIWAERYERAATSLIEALTEEHRLAGVCRTFEETRQEEREGAVQRIIVRETPEGGKPFSRSRAEELTRTDDRYADFVRRQGESLAAKDAAYLARKAAELELARSAMAHERAAILARLTIPTDGVPA